MSYQYTYILAPDVDNNAQIMAQFASIFADLVEEKRIKAVFKRDTNDIIDNDGGILVATGERYFLVKATASEFDPATMLQGVTAPQTFNRDNLPFNDFWL